MFILAEERPLLTCGHNFPFVLLNMHRVPKCLRWISSISVILFHALYIFCMMSLISLL